MKKILLIPVILLSITNLHGQNVYFDWAKQMGGTTTDDVGLSVAVDASGNVYTTGQLGNNAFISKIDTTGMLSWTKQMTGTLSKATSMVIDESGNVLITGKFNGTVDFDPGPGTFNLTAISDDQFISKLDAGGNFIWTKQIGGTIHGDNIDATSIATDSRGNVYTTGGFDGDNIDFDPGPGVFVLNKGYPAHEIFVSKLDSNGNFAWAKHMKEAAVGSAIHSSWGYSIAVDSTGNVYTTGEFANNIDFDPGPGVFYLYQNTYDYKDAFISKLDAAGNFLWAKQLKGQNADAGSWGTSLAIDPLGNIYITGNFLDTVDFDPGPATLPLFSADGNSFISKLDAAGNLISVKQFGAGGGLISRSIDLDAYGNIFITGNFGGTADFDPGPGTINLTTAGDLDVFILKLNANGNFVWAKQMGGTGDDYGYSIALDGSQNIYTTGYFVNTVDFDPGPGMYNLTSAGANDIFIHKLGDSTVVNTYINSYTPVLTVDPCANKFVTEDASAFNPGDTVLLIQMKGAVIDSSNTVNFGAITDYKSAGNYEFNFVKSKVGNIIELKNVPAHQYDIPNGKVQLVRVPYFQNINITSTLTCLPWDGSKGGVLVLNVKDTITMNADIDVSGKGFRGGVAKWSGQNLPCDVDSFYIINTNSDDGSAKGEGIFFNTRLLNGRGKAANGGGGGNSTNSGGAGGGNGGKGGTGGKEWVGCQDNFINGGIGGDSLTYNRH